MSGRLSIALAALWLLACFALAYLPDIGHGFIKDDYGWIASSHLTDAASLRRLFVETPMGFYRPLVSLSFGLNEWLTGADSAFAFAGVNAAIAVTIAAAIWLLAQQLGLSAAASLFAAAVWLFNVHGINMSLLWISGRTSLLGTLGAVAAAGAFVSGRTITAGLLTLLALLAKEEPLFLAVVFALWLEIDWRTRATSSDAPRPWRRWGVALAPSFVAVGVYLLARAQTTALTPATAPDYYRLSVAAVGGNAVQYLDRSMTFPAALLLLGLLAASWRAVRVQPHERVIVAKGLIWLVGGFALTILVPVRSSLYVLLPTVGSALAAAAVGSAVWRGMRRRGATLVALMLLPLALVPLYRARNVRIRNEAVLAARVLTAIRDTIATRHPARIVVVSPTSDRPSMRDSFGDALPIALSLFVPDASKTAIVVQAEEGAGGDAVIIRAQNLMAR